MSKALNIKQKLSSDLTTDGEVADALHEIGGCSINTKNLTNAKDYLEKELKTKQQLQKNIDTEQMCQRYCIR